tara:strand:+ start:186 stop:1160 length:975 start_codon:yes stop_codon:yes gene_type:complete
MKKTRDATKIRFQKAKCMQAFYKGSVYGPPGSGKTYTTLKQATGLAELGDKRIAYIDTERGTDFYTDEFDFDCLYTRSLSDVLEAVHGLNPEEHGVIVIDSISHLWDAAIAAYEGKLTKAETIPMQAWGKIKKPYKDLIRWLMDAPFHVFILGRQKNIFETSSDGQMTKVGVGMRAEGETEYEPHICSRMECRKNEQDTSKSTYIAVYEKDRTGKLAGRTFANPSFKTIQCIVPLLNGESQAQSENPDDVAAKDSELLDKAEAEKEKKSAELLEACKSLVSEATNLKELAEVGDQIKPKTRYMNNDDTKELRSSYNIKQKKLAA